MASLRDFFSEPLASSPLVQVATLEHLMQFSLLRVLEAELLTELLLSARLETHDEGDWIFHAGDADDTDYFLVSGAVALQAADGRLHYVEAGGVMSQQPLARLRPRQFSARMERRGTVLVISHAMLQTLSSCGRVNVADEGRQYLVEEWPFRGKENG